MGHENIISFLGEPKMAYSLSFYVKKGSTKIKSLDKEIYIGIIPSLYLTSRAFTEEECIKHLEDILEHVYQRGFLLKDVERFNWEKNEELTPFVTYNKKDNNDILEECGFNGSENYLMQGTFKKK